MALFQYFRAPSKSRFLSTNVAPNNSRASILSLWLVWNKHNTLIYHHTFGKRINQKYSAVEI